MALFRRNRTRRPKGPQSLRRSFVTPEGVDLQIELGGAGVRAAAFMVDAVAMLILLILATIAIVLLFVASKQSALAILWLLGFFVLRNGWFALFEMGGRGATPGKRLMGLRVVARDGARLTGGAVIARNAMREIEVFLPLSFLMSQAVQGLADSFVTIFALGWSGIFLFFPLFNRDRLRIGDLLAGTWVVRTVRGELGADLVVASGACFPKPRSICTASTSCRRWRRSCAAGARMPSPPSPPRSGARRGYRTIMTIAAFSTIIMRPCAVGLNADCWSGGGVRINSPEPQRYRPIFTRFGQLCGKARAP